MTSPRISSPVMKLLAGAAALFIAVPAQPVTLTALAKQGLDSIFGSYAPKGNCATGPVITIAATGMTFKAAGATLAPKKIEWALTYFGPDYDGISKAIFPFPVNSDDMGPVLMTVNADEKAGTIVLEPDLPPGKSLDPVKAALVKASPYLKCKAKT